jgi:hypothetical protein
MPESPEPFLRRVGETFAPTRMANGFWGPKDNLHARVMIGLFAHVIEQRFGEPEFQPARLTVDLYRLPDLAPVTVATRLIRQGGRIKVVEAELFSGDVSSARASCQLLRRTQQPEAPIWSRPTWVVPPPEQIPPPEHPFTEKWEMRPILPPAASNASESGLAFINSDVTLYLHRLPVGEWIGYEVTDHQSAEGVAIGHCVLHDVDGPVGFSSCAALAQSRRS